MLWWSIGWLTHTYICSGRTHTAYYNRKGFYSFVLQGLVDHCYCFIDLYKGWPGSVHDARMFSQSSWYKKGTAGTLYPNWTAPICSESVPIVILGDSAYPLLNWFVKPFPHKGALTNVQKKFNYHLSTASVVSENPFGQLKGRWRCLSKHRYSCTDCHLLYLICVKYMVMNLILTDSLKMLLCLVMMNPGLPVLLSKHYLQRQIHVIHW